MRGEYVRRSLDLRSWDAATDLVRGWEASGEIGVIRKTAPTIAEAVEKFLEKGVSLETVSVLLGHSSLKITERHYKPWMKKLQTKLEEEVTKLWAATAAP